MSTRIKSKKITFQTRAEFEAAVDQMAALQLKLDQDVAAFNKAKSDEEKAFKAKVAKTKDRISELFASAEIYAEANREILLGERQSAQTSRAFFGYRKSPGVLKTLNAKWTFARAQEALKAAGKTACIKITESLNKAAVKSSIPEEELSQYGLRYDYPEDFWVEPIRELKSDVNA